MCTIRYNIVLSVFFHETIKNFAAILPLVLLFFDISVPTQGV